MNEPGARAVLLTGAYGSGKSSVAEQIAYLVRRDVMTFLGWP